MSQEDVKVVALSGYASVQEAEHTPARYFVRAMLGGMMLFIGIFLSIMAGQYIRTVSPMVGSLVGAFTFPIGLLLIIFLGGQLFTSVSFTTPAACYTKLLRPGSMVKTLTICFIGNIVGLAIMCLILFVCDTKSHYVALYLTEYTMVGRFDVSLQRTFVRAVLCNFYIATASFVSYKMKSEIGKIVCIFFVIAGFVLSGTDHSIANAGYFMLYALTNFEAAQPDLLVMPLYVLVAVLGNFVGGAGLAAVIWFSGGGKDISVYEEEKLYH